MALSIGTLTGKIHRDAEVAIQRLARELNAQQALVEALQHQPAPLTPAQIAQALSVTGVAPLNVTALIGASGGIATVGTHAQRIATPPKSAGSLFIETDRGALYYGNATLQWVLDFGFATGSYAARPGDLGLNDDNYWYNAQDQATLSRWTGAAWHYQIGCLTDTYANRPASGGTNIATGFRFAASNMGYQEWVYDRAAMLWKFAGGGNPMTGTLSPNTKPALGAEDAGFRFFSTDFVREYTWAGAAWADSVGEDTRLIIGMFAADPGAGWYPMDGASHAISTATGGTSTDTPPDYSSTVTYLRSATSFGGTGTFGAVGANYQFGDVRLYRRG